MPDESLAPTLSPTAESPVAAPVGMDEETLGIALADAAREFEESGIADEEPIVTDDFNAALGLDEETWEINTGRRDIETDRPIKLKVIVRDPGRSESALGYVYNPNKEEAARLLVQSVLVSPAALCEKQNWSKLRTAPRLMLVWRTMGLLGIDGDFFENLQKMASEKERRAARSLSTKSRSPTGSRGGSSEIASRNPEGSETSQTPSSTPTREKNASEAKPSSTESSHIAVPKGTPNSSTLKLTSPK